MYFITPQTVLAEFNNKFASAYPDYQRFLYELIFEYKDEEKKCFSQISAIYGLFKEGLMTNVKKTVVISIDQDHEYSFNIYKEEYVGDRKTVDSLPLTVTEIETALKEWDYDICKYNKFTYRFPNNQIQPIIYCEGSEVKPLILYCYTKAVVPNDLSGMDITKAYKES